MCRFLEAKMNDEYFFMEERDYFEWFPGNDVGI